MRPYNTSTSFITVIDYLKGIISAFFSQPKKKERVRGKERKNKKYKKR
jgi:hypothetical protein